MVRRRVKSFAGSVLLLALGLFHNDSIIAALKGRPAAQSTGQWPTLRQVLLQQGVKETGELSQSLLSTPVTSYAVDAGDREVIAAFFGVDGTLHVALVDRPSSRSQHATVSIDDAAGTGNSIIDLKHTRRFIYLDTHINPSAGRLIILSRDLKLLRALYGWELAILPDETVVYHHGQMHFAPTHSLEISVFSPATMKERQIYPPKPPQPVRKAFIDRVAEVYAQRGEEWFSQHNHHMNPERFDSRLESGVVADAAAQSISFRVRFGDPDNANDPLPFSEYVAVTCGPTDRITQIRCRERP